MNQRNLIDIDTGRPYHQNKNNGPSGDLYFLHIIILLYVIILFFHSNLITLNTRQIGNQQIL